MTTITAWESHALLARTKGYTPGPWKSFFDDSGGRWTGWPLSVSATNFVDKTVVRTGGQWPYEWDAMISQYEACRNAELIAASPDLVAHLAAALDSEAAMQSSGSWFKESDIDRLMDERDAARAEADKLQDISIDLAAHLAAAISLLERGGKAAKKAAPSGKMFDQMLKDYQASLDRARAALAQETDQ